MNKISFLMRAIAKEDEIISLKQNPHSLEQSLAPLWKLTYYGGMLLDWCRPIPRGRFSTILRCVVIALALTIAFYQLFSLTVQLFWIISNPGKKFEDLVTLIGRISLQPTVLLTWLLFLLRRCQLLEFYRDWAKQETLTPAWTVDYSSIRRTFLKVNAVLTILSCCFITFCIYLMAIVDLNTFQDVLLFYIPNLLNSTWFTVTFRVQFILWSLFITTFIIVTDLVPAFVYYHVAKHVEAMEKEIRLQVMDDHDSCSRLNVMKMIWNRYEEWRRLIRWADQLFGPIIILNHGASFFLICCDVCSLLNYFKHDITANKHQDGITLQNDSNDDYDGFWQILFILINAIRLVFGIFMMAKIPKECDSLSTTLIRLSTSYYHLANKEERCIMKSFLNRLQSGGLVASPADFYSITPSILLTMLSLIVTYSVIMLQT